MTAYAKWTDFEGLQNQYSQKSIFDALIFVAETVIDQGCAQGIALPEGFDEIHEILNRLQDNREPEYNDFHIRLYTMQDVFWNNFGYFLIDLAELQARIRPNTMYSRSYYAFITYSLSVYTRLSVLTNSLQQIDSARPEGHHIVWNLLMDRLEGRI